MNEPVAIGVVRKPFGVVGQCYVSAFGDTLSRLRAPFSILAGKDAQTATLCTVTESRQSPKGFTVRFLGIETMNAAETMRDAMLFVDSKDLPDLGDGKHYSFELIGCTVIAFEDKTSLGTVVDVESYPTVDCLVVRRENGATFLLSMLPDIVKQVDKQARLVVVMKSAVEDLLE
jgi:16S rRNA processing protein RimM